MRVSFLSDEREFVMKRCPYCFSDIALGATICPHCRRKVGELGKGGFAKKPPSTIFMLFCSFITIVIMAIIVGSLSDKSPRTSKRNYDLSPEPFRRAQDSLSFTECALWYGGDVNTGEVYEQYVHVVVASANSEKGDLMRVVRLYRSRFSGCEYLDIQFYPTIKDAPRTKDDFWRIFGKPGDKSFAGYFFEPVNNRDTLIYYEPRAFRKGSLGEVKQRNPSQKEIKTLSDFAKCTFCQIYDCIERKSWALRDGGTNHTYECDIKPDVSLEVQTRGTEVYGIGLMFYYRESLSSDDFVIISDLIDCLGAKQKSAKAKQFIKAQIERRVHQIRQAKPIQFGSYTIWAGKVGYEQIVDLEKR